MAFKEVGKELPEVWKPTKEGETLVGIYARKKINTGPNNSNLYIFEVKGKLKSAWGSAVLDDAMSDPKIEIGDTLRITYEGENKKLK